MGCTTSLAFVSKRRITMKERKTLLLKTVAEPDIALTEEQKTIIKRHWRVLSTDIQKLGTAVFLQIFRDHPEVKQLFPCRDIEDDKLISSLEFRGHAYRFMQAVGAVVDNIDDLENTMGNALLFLGKQHVTFMGIKSVYFDDFYDVISKVWKDVLGRRYTPETEKAWGHVFSYIMEKLKKGFESAQHDGVTVNNCLQNGSARDSHC